jgi:hypothetical protein
MRGQKQAGLAMHCFALRLKLAQPEVGAPVLPAEQGRQRPAVAPVPADAARALAGEARRDDVAPALSERRQGLRRGGENRGDHFVAILLRPVRLRPREAAVLRAARQYASAAIEHHRAARVRALVNCEIKRIGDQAERDPWRVGALRMAKVI